MVYYRKYRPQTIEELDSSEVREKLKTVLRDTPHAFLFTGPKGLGKTSTARIVAKVINCERLASSKLASSSKGKQLSPKRYTLDADIEPCNKCEQCLSITNGTNLDVLEIDAASNRGIDEIRDLREKIKLSPIAAKKKVYIIDEVHMLTTEAFNALLKTLEEPPLHAVFILCTTELHKVPETIASRCFHIGFKTATTVELVRSFQRIVAGEELEVEKDALEEIAKLSGGSFRDGAKILEELATLTDGKKITKVVLEKQYRVAGITHYTVHILEALEKRDVNSALQIIGKVTEQGVDMKYFIEQLITALHSHILKNMGIEMSEQFSIFNFQFSIDEIRELIQLLSKAHQDTKSAVLPQLPLEIAVIEWSLRNETEETQGTNGTQRTVHDLVREKKNIVIRKVVSQHSGGAKKDIVEPKVTARQTDISKRTGGNDHFFEELVEEVKLKNHSIAGVLRGCKIAEFTNGNLVLQTPYKFHKERLDELKARGLLEQVAQSISGKKVTISVQLVKK